jgi:hypothetical protein
MSPPLKLVRVDEKNGTVRWAHGHISAEKMPMDKGGIRLTVNTSPAASSSTPALTSQDARVASQVLLAAASNAGGLHCVGKSLIETLWEEMDRLMEGLMTEQDAEDGGDRYRAEQLCWVIAYFQNPYAPSMDAVRGQAMERWELAQEAAERLPAKPAVGNGQLRARRAARRASRG